MDGSEGFRADTVKSFVAILSELIEIPIVLSDERLTTMEAHRFLSMTDVSGKKRKASVDMLSAEIILQDYLDKMRKSNA
jgi:putative Holliday junction resolvase